MSDQIDLSKGWIKRVDRLFGDGHCKTSYEHSMAHLFDAPEYRTPDYLAKFDEESA